MILITRIRVISVGSWWGMRCGGRKLNHLVCSLLDSLWFVFEVLGSFILRGFIQGFYLLLLKVSLGADLPAFHFLFLCCSIWTHRGPWELLLYVSPCLQVDMAFLASNITISVLWFLRCLLFSPATRHLEWLARSLKFKAREDQMGCLVFLN